MQIKIQPGRHLRTQSVGSGGGLLFVGLVLLLLFAGGFGAVVVTSGGGRVAPAADGTDPTASTQATSEQAAVIGRLRQILRVRDQAYERRDARLLESVYTVDCPCLRADRAIIGRLLEAGQVQVGGSTELANPTAERVGEQQWLVSAVVRSAPLRVERESGQLVRTEAPDVNLWRFALARPPGADDWLLGRASLVREGG